MAIISIPTSIGGISIPGSLASGPLAALVNPTGGSKTLQYPSDLLSSPTKSHAVYFTIKKVQPMTLDEKKTSNLDLSSIGSAAENLKINNSLNGLNTSALAQVSSSITNVTNNITSTASNFVGSTVGNAVNSVTNAIGSAVDGVAQGASSAISKLTGSSTIKAFLKPPTKDIDAVIALYMPDTLNISYSADYQDFSLTSDLGTKGRIGQTGLDVAQAAKSGAGWDQAVKNLASGPGAIELAGAALDTFGGTSNGSDYLLKAGGYAVNPQIQLIYKGIALREFQLDFVFTPKTQQESNTTKDIIAKFKENFLPELKGASGGNEGQYFTMPSIFNIQFKFSNTDGVVSSVISNVLGSLGKVGTALAPVLPSGSSNNSENDNLYKVGDCVLTNIDVDYAPNGWASHTDGAPIQTKLSLRFKEMDIMDRKSFMAGNVR
jgi:hypothetical protein